MYEMKFLPTERVTVIDHESLEKENMFFKLIRSSSIWEKYSEGGMILERIDNKGKKYAVLLDRGKVVDVSEHYIKSENKKEIPEHE